MKKGLLIAILALSFSTVFAQKESQLVGTWKLVSGKAVINDSTENYGATDGEALKIVTPTHFSVIATSADGTFRHATAGRVKMDATTYQEMLDFSSVKSLLSKTATFTYKMEGGRWHIMGGMDNMKFDEIWERVR